MWTILKFNEVSSTNTLATEMLARGEAKHGDVIVARHQTSGRGRGAGRVWNDEPDASLLTSIILTKIPSPAHLLQYRMALAVLDAIRERMQQPTEARLKWPNDILIDGKKVCGLLVEGQWNGDTMRSAIVGIGLNVRQRAFPGELGEIATSLYQCGTDIPVAEIRDIILEKINLELIDAKSEAVLSRLRKELAWMEQLPSVTFTDGNGEVITALRFAGIDDSGVLRLRKENGSVLTVNHGSLSWN